MGARVDVLLESVLPHGDPHHMHDLADFFYRRDHAAFSRVDKLFDAAVLSTNIRHEYPLFQMTDMDIDRSKFPLGEGHGRRSVLRTCDGKSVLLPCVWQVQKQIQATVTEHKGEVRSWPTNRHDAWRPVQSVYAGVTITPPTPKEMGHNFEQTMIEPSVFERCAVRGVSYDPMFTSRLRCVHERGCHPDLDRAISTLAVWDNNDQTMCVRQHWGVTLAEAFDRLGSRVKYRTLYDEWLKGKLLFRASRERSIAQRSDGRHAGR